MILRLFSWYFKLAGWKFEEDIPREVYRRSVIIAAPHTSNWDFVIAAGAFYLMKIPIKFTIKKEAMVWPFSLFLNSIGAIPIDRRPKDVSGRKESLTDAMVRAFEEQDDICMIFTAEGTRKKVSKWKTGFYHVAKAANVPMILTYADYKRKVLSFTKVIHPTDDIQKDMEAIMDFYKNDYNPKHPERFTLDERYS